MSEDHLYNETLKDKFTLSPFQKYEKYKRFPFKFVIGCILVFLTSFQVMFISQYYSFNNAEQIQAWVQLFLNPDDPQNNRAVFLTLQDFQDSLKHTLDYLTNLNDNSIQYAEVKGNVSFQINFNYPYDAYLSQKNFEYEVILGQPILQPFDIENVADIKRFWYDSYGLTLIIKDLKVQRLEKEICWDLKIKYTYTDYGYISAEQSSTGGICQNSVEKGLEGNIFAHNQIGFDYGFLQIMVFAFAFADLCLGIKYIYEVIEMYTNNIYKQNKLRRIKVPEYKLYKNQNLTTLKMILNEQKPWDQLSIKEKLLFFDLFLPLRILGNLFQIVASSVLIAEGFVRVNNLSSYDETFVGIGAFFAWFAMVKYLDYYEELHLIASVLESSIIPLCLAILNFLPVFFAYVFLGMCLFSDSHRFSTIQEAISSLIALIYGDSISDITRDSSRDVSLEVTLIFMCSYILLFIFAVNNIMVALIKEQLEIRKDLIQTEKELMNQLDINSHKLNKLRDESPSVIQKSQQQQQQQQQQQKISLRSIAKLAIMLNRSSDPVTKTQLEHNWKRVSKEEIQKNYIYNFLIQNIKEVKDQLGQIEREVWNDMDTVNLDTRDKKEIISYYCSLLIKLHQQLRNMYDKTNQIESEWLPIQS